MLKRLKRWLGWDSDSGLLDFADFGVARRAAAAGAEAAGRGAKPRRGARLRSPGRHNAAPRPSARRSTCSTIRG